MPFHGKRGTDEAYDRLRFGTACEPVLIRELASDKKMPDPRQVPPDSRFSVGDAALFILLERHGVPIEAVVPADIAQRMNSEGIYAYFDFVNTRQGRESVAVSAKRIVESQQ